MKNFIATKSLRLNLLIKIAFSFLLAFLAAIGATYNIQWYIINSRQSITQLMYNLLALGMFAIGIITFSLCFLLTISKEMKYIKYIAKQVKLIVNQNLGITLEVRGNDELAELSSNINLMSLALKERFEKERELEKTKNELITNVSHDLRTPLTAIIGYLDILKNEKFNNREEEKEYLTSTYNLSIKLKKLIDELFEYTKLSGDEAKLELVEVDICSILNQIIGEYTPVLEDKGLKVISNIPNEELFIKIDIEKIVRVFDNILNNAEKYSIKPSDIMINLENKNDVIIISFSNKGEYIEQDKLDKMFERFYRVDTSRSSNIEGSGLGLAISQKIIELHNGAIWAESKEHIITFIVKLRIS